jgi:uncharacterized protein DUF3631
MIRKSPSSEIMIVPMPVGQAGRVGRDFEAREGEPLDDAVEFLKDYIVLPDQTLVTLVAWIAASYLMDVWDRFPHLAVTSPSPRCGKSRLLELISLLVPNPIFTSNISAAALYRTIAKLRPTLLFDEAQSLKGQTSERSSDLKIIFNASISRDSAVLRCGQANYDKVKSYSVWCPKVMALVGAPDNILADRCLPIALKRKTSEDFVKPLIMRTEGPRGKAIANGLKKWADEYKDGAGIVYEDVATRPLKIDNDRFAELLMPLQVVLEISGNGLELLEDYAYDLNDRDKHKLTVGELLLHACREIFDGNSAQFLPTEQLLDFLSAREEEPWSTWRKGEPLNSEGLAWQLKPYEIYPQHSKDKKIRGYWKVSFLDAWARYLPPTSQSPSNPSKSSNSSSSQKPVQPVRDDK